MLTQVGGVALTLWQHGPQAAWLAISAHAQGLRAQALDFVQQQVLAVAAKAVPLLLASLVVPGGAFLQLARSLYHGVLLFVEAFLFDKPVVSRGYAACLQSNSVIKLKACRGRWML